MAEFPDRFKVVGLAAGSNVTLLADQVIKLDTLIQTCNGTFVSITEWIWNHIKWDESFNL